eukprot:655347-Prymnesium_polylepis.1
MHGLKHYAARNHPLARAQPQFLCATSNDRGVGTHRMPPSQASLGSVSSHHPWVLAYPLLARCVEGA